MQCAQPSNGLDFGKYRGYTFVILLRLLDYSINNKMLRSNYLLDERYSFI